ncbi:MAG: CARDB domain-containing protein, partial [Cyanobacteria bacterium P01_F01_bin.143]
FTKSDGSSVDNPVLDLAAGDYILSIDGRNAGSTYSFTLSDLAQAERMTPGIPVNGDLWRETDFYQFEVEEAGDKFFFDVVSRSGVPKAYWRLFDPDGSLVFDEGFSSSTGEGSFTLSNPGNYTLLVEGRINEPINNQGSYSFNVDPIATDITVSAVTTSQPLNEVTWGDAFDLTWQVSNQGNIPLTGGWQENIYLSQDEKIDENDILLIPLTSIDSDPDFDDTATIVLDTGGISESRTKSIVIDKLNLDLDTNWNILVEVESNQRDKNNANNIADTAITILPPDYADLVVDVDKIDFPKTAYSGSEIEVTWEVNNQGNAGTEVDDAWYDRIVLSANNILGDEDDLPQQYQVQHQGIVEQGESYPKTATIKLPEEIEGQYYILIETDFNQDVFEFVYEDNNVEYSTEKIDISLKPVADLEVNSESIKIIGDKQPGQTIRVDWSLTNNGEADANSRIDRLYLLSPSGTFNNPIRIVNLNQTKILEAGKTHDLTADVPLPNDLVDGEYQIIIVTDFNDDVEEREGENNNQNEIPLTITHVDILPTLTDIPTETITSGTTIPITLSVENLGTGTTINNWKDRIYLSADNTFDVGLDQEIAFFEHTEAIAPGGTKEETIDIEIPIEVSGKYYLIVVGDADNNLLELAGDNNAELAGENNNVQAVEIDIELATYHDLVVSNVIAPDRTIDDPARVNISWTVTNEGTGQGREDSWTDAVVVSEDEIFGNDDDLVIGEYIHTGGLAKDASYTKTESILLPPAFVGRYYLYVESDYENNPENLEGIVFENGLEDNNIKEKENETSEFFDVMPIPYADLRITEVRPTSTASSGQPLSVEWEVVNEGIGITNVSNWNDILYLASDPEGKNIVQNLGSFNHAGALGIDGRYTRSATVTLPNDISGEYYLVAETGRGVFEFIYDDDDSNKTISESVTVSLTAPPDLTVTDIIAPSTITAGEKIDLTWQVENIGTGNAIGGWRDRVYLQEIGTDLDDLISLASYTYDAGLEAGKFYSRQEKIIIPAELQGQYQIVVETNTVLSSFEIPLFEGSNTENNRSVSNETIQIRLPDRPDLQVVLIDVTDEVAGGSSVTLEFTVKNQGKASTTAANWTDTVYLSLDDKISSDDIIVGRLTNGAALNPGESYQSTTDSFLIPLRFRGNVHLIVDTDSGNQVNELPQESNNFKAEQIKVEFTNDGSGGGSPLPADLVTGGVIAPDRAFDGSTIEVSYKVTNRGVGTTNVDSWTDTIWLTRDRDRPSAGNRQDKSEDILLETITHTGEIPVDGVYQETVSVTIPDQITGEWYITPWSDTYDVVLEDTFDNNIDENENDIGNNNYQARPITVLLTPPPDLVVEDVIATTEAKGGDPFSVTWTVENQGAGATRENIWEDFVYLTDEPSLDESKAIWTLGKVIYEGSLAPGEKYTQTANFDLSPAAYGQYVIVSANDSATVGNRLAWEGPYENNNENYVDTPVTNAPADLVLESIKVPETSYSGEKITVEWTVVNEGEPMWPGTKYWYDGVLLSPDPEFILGRAKELGRIIFSPDKPLGTGDSYTQRREFTLPPGIDGEYYIYIEPDLFDPKDRKEEAFLAGRGSLTNVRGRINNEHSRETFIDRGFEDRTNNLGNTGLNVDYREPDLKVTALQISDIFPNAEGIIPNFAPESGSTISVSWTTTNIGTRETRDETFIWYDRVYLSRDPSLDFQDILLGEYERQGGLDIRESYDASLNVQLPENIEGDYYILVFADSNIRTVDPKRTKLAPEGSKIYYEIGTVNELARIEEFKDEGNNITEAGLQIILRDPPDLQVTEVRVPERAIIGQTFDLTYKVENKGSGNPTKEEWNDLIYFSRDQFLDLESDIYLKTIPHIGGFDASQSYTIENEPIDIPTNISGQFYVFVITDPASSRRTGQVFEGGLDFNNSGYSSLLTLDLAPPVDLEVEEITFPNINPPNSVLSGDKITIQWKTTNNNNPDPNGESPIAEGTWSDAVYLSSDGIWDIEDVLLGRVELSGPLGPEESLTNTLETVLPPAVSDEYRIIVRPDIYNQIYERNEDNNRTASGDPLKITVEEIYLGVEKSTTFRTGQARLYQIDVDAGDTLRVIVDSKSENAANELFIKQGSAPTSTDYDFAYNSGLNADQTVIVPKTEPGTYYILVNGFSQPVPDTNTVILAESLPFGISNVVSDRGGDSNYVTTHIYGARFGEDALVEFVRPGIGEFVPVRYEVIDATHIIAIFDFEEVPHGLYDVKVINPDGEEAIAPYRYLVERAIERDVSVGSGGPRVLSIGETGTYSVSVRSLTNLDTPYVHFQFGVPELDDNGFLLGKFRSNVREEVGIEALPYVGFTSNLRGTPPVAATDDLLVDLPWASLVSDINTDGEILAPGYIYDFPTAAVQGFTFNAQAYPGLNDLLALQPDALDDLDPGDDARIAFQFHIQAAATVLTRDEFIAQQTESALTLRENILNDNEASPSLALLAADPDIWVTAYLAALEAAGLLRPENEAPTVRENPLALSMMATLASGILVGAAGERIITDGDLLGFFAQLRKWYGHDETLIGQNTPPDSELYDLGVNAPTHFEAFDVFVPFGEQLLHLPDGTNVPNPRFADFLDGSGEVSQLSNITGPIITEENGLIPIGATLPYTIQFANSPNASASVGEVNIVTQLDSNLDPRSFRLGDLQLGDIRVHIPEGRATFTGDFDFTGTKGFVLRVNAGLDPLSNIASWLLQAIDPENGEVIDDPDFGLLPPNDAIGSGSGFVGYTIAPLDDLVTGTEISANARIIYNTAPALDTPTIFYTIDGAAPATTITVEALNGGNNDYLVRWDAVDEADGSGVRHVTVYVAEDGGDFKIWQRQTTDTEAVFTGETGRSYEFLALATDNAGNQELAPRGITAPDDGTITNFGNLTSVGLTSEPTPIPAPPPNIDRITNPIFTETAQEIPNSPNLTNPSEFNSVLRPFKVSAFATGIAESHGDISALAIVELPDESFLISGGRNRGSIYQIDRVGGDVGRALIELPVPIFDLELDENNTLWATTGGGALLQLDSSTGEIISQYGEGITQALAIDPETGLIYLSSSNGIEIFDPIAETFTHFSNLRVGSLEFDKFGVLWANRWPNRGEVVRFVPQPEKINQEDYERLEEQPQSVFEFDLPIDSLAFGKENTELDNLLFISSNSGELIMVDLATREYVTVADGGSRGDILQATSDGRLLISQSNQVDVFSPVISPEIAFTNPSPDGIVALPRGTVSVTFDQEMYVGEATEANSVLNPDNYSLTSNSSGNNLIPLSITYDATSNTATLNFNALETDQYTFSVTSNLTNIEGLELPEAYQIDFSAVSDFSAFVDLEFTNTRSDRANQTVSFDVSLTNRADYDFLLPIALLLESDDKNNTAEPLDSISRSESGAYFLDLSKSLEDGVLRPGESITGQTVTIYNPDNLRFEFEPAIYTLPTTNQAPVFDSEPITVATAGETYIYNVRTTDPDGSVIGYLLYDAPEEMTIDDGILTWNPTADSPVQTDITLHVYDSRGGRAIQEFTIDVVGGNQEPVFIPLAQDINGNEGELIELNISASDADGDRLEYWADNLPAGASFDSETRIFSWIPGFDAARTYEDVTFIVSDGVNQVATTTTFLITPANQAPILLPIVPKTYVEGDAIRFQLQASDPDTVGANGRSPLQFNSNLLPGGAFLDPNTGVFEWTPEFFQAGEYSIPFTVSDGEAATTEIAQLEILNVNAAPVFNNLDSWFAVEGQNVNFRAFAFDPDNPGFVPQERLSNGELTVLEGTDSTVNYLVTGLPDGATFDLETAIFDWNPDFDNAGVHSFTVTATDDGNGDEQEITTQTINITIGDVNRPPEIPAISNQIVPRGDTLDLLIETNDPDGDTIAIRGTGVGGFGLPDFVTLTDNGNGTANLQAVPGDGDRGNYPIVLIATDERDVSASYSFILTVEAVNERPVLQYIGDKIAIVDEPLEFTVFATDPDQDDLTFSATELPNGAELIPVIANDQEVYGQALFKWTPTSTNTDPYAITIKVEDSGNRDSNESLSSEETFDLIVRTVNTEPIFPAIADQNIIEGDTLSFALGGSDPDGDILTYSVNNLPRGATLDPITGQFTWNTDFFSQGVYDDVEFTLSDGHSSSSQIISINVENNNRLPSLTPLPAQATRENVELSFTLKGNDIDAEPIFYSAISDLPEGARLDSSTGEFTWKPNYEQAKIEAYELEFAVTDGNEPDDSELVPDSEIVEILVDNVNRTPSIDVAPQIVALGEELEFTLQGDDPDLYVPTPDGSPPTPLQYSAANLPDGAVLDPNTGIVTWTPSPGQVGDYIVTYQVSDGEITAEKNGLIRVETQSTPPIVNIELTPSFPAIPGQKVVISALADSFTTIENVTLTANGTELTLDSRNRGEFVPDQPGRIEIVATAIDAAERIATTTEVIKVRDPEDEDAPIVAFGLGLDEAFVEDAIAITGTVSDTNLDEWFLTVEANGRSPLQSAEIIASGDGTFNNAEITTFDPALYGNGFYTLELTAIDVRGRSSTTEIVVEVNSDSKQKQYLRQDTDLAIAFADESVDETVDETVINLVRRYDSLSRDQVGSFGNGWELATGNFNLETSNQDAADGREVPFEDGTRVYLTLPDGKRVGFTFQPIAEDITGLTYYKPAWVADVGVNYSLESADALLSVARGRYYDLQTARPYNPNVETLHATSLQGNFAYTLTAPDGTVYKLDANGSVVEQITVDGTRLIYSDSGILNPETGEMVSFESDDAGRLTQITAPDGTAVVYTYDDAGNLVGARNLALGDSIRYSYGESGLNLIAGDTGEAIDYFDDLAVLPVVADLGTASRFTGIETSGTLNDGNSDFYSLGFRDSEINSTATGFVLLGVDVDGNTELPTIEGLTPVTSQTNTDTNSSFALFTIEQAGLNLLSIRPLDDNASPYDLRLTIAGDVNGDGAVDGLDSQAVTAALDLEEGDVGYDIALDVNRDRVIDQVDIQILGSNYGFAANQAPVVIDGNALTHEDLSVAIPLGDLASDPEGDRIFYRAIDVENGKVTFAPDGETAIFTPDVGYTGAATFKLLADDGFAVSDPGRIEINVSDEPLTSLDFVVRNPQLEVGEQFELQVIGDFADQEDVLLPGDYLNWTSENEDVAIINDSLLIGIGNGTSIVSAERDDIETVTVSRVGDSLAPTDDTSFNSVLAEDRGLDIYPNAVTLTLGINRQILVGINGEAEEPDLLSNADTGTRYFVNNSEVLTVNQDGLITTLTEGEAEVIIIHGGTEAVLPVKVEAPQIGATTLDIDGGVVQGSDGSLVMIPELALLEDATVDIKPLTQEELSLDIPEADYSFIGAFNLKLGDRDLLRPAQLAIPAPDGLEVGKEVFFLRKGELPDENGNFNSVWFLQESGIVGADGFIRTSSPPFEGAKQTGEYSIVIPKFEYSKVHLYAALGATALGIGFNATGVVSIVGKASIDNVKDEIAAIGNKIGEILNDTDFGQVAIEVAQEYVAQIVKENLLEFLESKLPTSQEKVFYLEAANLFIDAFFETYFGVVASEKDPLENVADKILGPILSYMEDLVSDLVTGAHFIITGQILLLNASKGSVTSLTIPKFGLPYTTDLEIDINPGQIAYDLTDQIPEPLDPLEIAITQISTKVPDSLVESRVVEITGNNLGDSLDELTVNFHLGNQVHPGRIISELSDLAAGKITAVSDVVPLREADISIEKKLISVLGTEEILNSNLVAVPQEEEVDLAVTTMIY